MLLHQIYSRSVGDKCSLRYRERIFQGSCCRRGSFETGTKVAKGTRQWRQMGGFAPRRPTSPDSATPFPSFPGDATPSQRIPGSRIPSLSPPGSDVPSQSHPFHCFSHSAVGSTTAQGLYPEVPPRARSLRHRRRRGPPHLPPQVQPPLQRTRL